MEIEAKELINIDDKILKEIEELEKKVEQLCYYIYKNPNNTYKHYIGCIYIDKGKTILDYNIHTIYKNNILNENYLFMLIKKWFLSYNNCILNNKKEFINIPNNSFIYIFNENNINYFKSFPIKTINLNKYSIINKFLECMIKSKKKAFLKLRIETENNYFENMISDFWYKSTFSDS